MKIMANWRRRRSARGGSEESAAALRFECVGGCAPRDVRAGDTGTIREEPWVPSGTWRLGSVLLCTRGHLSQTPAPPANSHPLGQGGHTAESSRVTSAPSSLAPEAPCVPTLYTVLTTGQATALKRWGSLGQVEDRTRCRRRSLVQSLRTSRR